MPAHLVSPGQPSTRPSPPELPQPQPEVSVGTAGRRGGGGGEGGASPWACALPQMMRGAAEAEGVRDAVLEGVRCMPGLPLSVSAMDDQDVKPCCHSGSDTTACMPPGRRQMVGSSQSAQSSAARAAPLRLCRRNSMRRQRWLIREELHDVPAGNTGTHMCTAIEQQCQHARLRRQDLEKH